MGENQSLEEQGISHKIRFATAHLIGLTGSRRGLGRISLRRNSVTKKQNEPNSTFFAIVS